MTAPTEVSVSDKLASIAAAITAQNEAITTLVASVDRRSTAAFDAYLEALAAHQRPLNDLADALSALTEDAIVEGVEAQREHKRCEDELAMVTAMLLKLRTAKQVIETRRKAAAAEAKAEIRRLRGIAFTALQEASAQLRKRAKEAEALGAFLELVRTASQRFEETDQRIRRYEAELGPEEVARLTEELYRDARAMRLALSVPGGRHWVHEVAVIPRLTGADSAPGVCYAPSRTSSTIGVDAHGEPFDPARFGIADPEAAAAAAAERERESKVLPSSIIEEGGRRWRVLSRHVDGTIRQREALRPGDSYYVVPPGGEPTYSGAFGEMGPGSGFIGGVDEQDESAEEATAES